MQDGKALFHITAFRSNRPLHWMLLWLVLFWAITAINPLYPFDWFLENLLVFIYGAILIFTYRLFAFSNTSYFLFTVFISMHLVGAHYTYAETPIGFWVQEWLDLSRNHYDRFVHFNYGFLLVYPFWEILVRTTHISRGWSYFLSINLITAFSAVYEIIEAVTAMVVSPELGAAYLGLQGDQWDAQWDMGLAMLGAMLAIGLTHFLSPAAAKLVALPGTRSQS